MKKSSSDGEDRAQAGQGQHHHVDGFAAEVFNRASHFVMPFGRRDDQKARHAVDHDGEGEQDQAQFDESAGVQVSPWLR